MTVDTNDLIAAIYAATLSPNDFPRVLEDLENVLFVEDGDGKLVRPLDETAETHIRLARNIQDRIGRSRSMEQRLAAIVESVPNPSYIVSQTETVVASNTLAIAKLGRAPTTLNQIVALGDVLSRVRDYVRRGEPRQSLAIAGQSFPGQMSQTSVLVNRIDPSISGADESLYLLSIIDFGFDKRVTELFREAYGLTDAEGRVAVLMASGLRLSDIAAERGVSVETVRTQIKVIKSKTAARDLPGLVRLLCGFTASLAGQSISAERDQPAPSEPLFARRRVELRGGRMLEYLEQGAPDGRPVILFHNVPYGVELPAAAIRQAHADGLRIIAPFRPGMGGTDPLAKTGPEEQLNGAAADCLELMDLLGIERARLLAHAVGSAFALRFASRHPDRVSHILAVSRAPAWKAKWISELPQRQRFMLRLARYFPQIFPVVVWSMVAAMESSHVTEFVQYNCRDGEADARATKNPETVNLIAQGSIDGLRNGAAAFCVETLIAQMDFVEEARKCRHKMHILHGDGDRIIPLAHSRSFAAEVPGTSLEVVEGAGQLMFFSHWRRMLDALKPRSAEAAREPAMLANSA